MRKHKNKEHRLWLRLLISIVAVFDVICLGVCAVFLLYDLIFPDRYDSLLTISTSDLAINSIFSVLSVAIPLMNRRFINDYSLEKSDGKNIRFLVQTIYFNLLVLSLVLLILGFVFYILELNFALIGLLIVNVILLLLFVISPGITLLVLKEDYILYLVRYGYLHHCYNIEKNDDSHPSKSKRRHATKSYFLNKNQLDSYISQILIKEKFDDNMINFFSKKGKYDKNIIFDDFAKNQIAYAKNQFEGDIFDIKKQKLDIEKTSISLLNNLFFISENDDYLLYLCKGENDQQLYHFCQGVCKLFSLAEPQSFYGEMCASSYSKIKGLIFKLNNSSDLQNESILKLLNSLAIESLSKGDVWFTKALTQSFVEDNELDSKNHETLSYYCIFITLYYLNIIISDDNSVSNNNKKIMEETLSTYSWRTFVRSGFLSSDIEYYVRLFDFLLSNCELHSKFIDWIPLVSNEDKEVYKTDDVSVLTTMLLYWLLFVFFAIWKSDGKINVHDFHTKMMESDNYQAYLESIKTILKFFVGQPDSCADLIEAFHKIKLFSQQETTEFKSKVVKIMQDFNREVNN